MHYNYAMPPSPLGRLRDRLPVNDPYDGVVAEAYDSWLPVDEMWPEEVAYREVLALAPGTILELGCGTGRPLIRWLAEGLDVEGLDASQDMLRILRRNAEQRGLEPTLHHADFAPLALGREYGAIVCLAGTFMLIDDVAEAEAALQSYYRHLLPGGLLGLSLGVSTADSESSLVWRLRRTGTSEDGTTYVVHEAVHHDPDDRVELVYNRIESYDPSGRLIDTTLRRHRLRSWDRAAFEQLLTRIGFVEVGSVGGDQAWVSFARRP
jgi:SAM-dependent methyltransferase